MIVEEIMTGDVRTVEENETVGEALAILAELEARHLPVVRGREVVGMISDRDLRSVGLSVITDQATLEAVSAQRSASVSTLMSGDLLTVDRAADVTEAIDLMLEESVGALPVVDSDTADLVGILSYVDVLRALREQL